MSNRRTSAKNLVELPAFRAAIQGTQSKVASEALLKHVVADVHGIGGLSHAKVQRARDLATRRTETDDIESYGDLSNLCSQILNMNPGSSICLQLDSK